MGRYNGSWCQSQTIDYVERTLYQLKSDINRNYDDFRGPNWHFYSSFYEHMSETVNDNEQLKRYVSDYIEKLIKEIREKF